MKQILILGGGTAGTMVANRLANELEPRDWKITVVDENDTHLYQPGLLFIPFDVYDRKDVIKPRRHFLTPGVELILAPIDRIDADTNRVHLATGRTLTYDFLIIATGSRIVPDETPGMAEDEWHRSIHDFYTLEGALTLRDTLRGWEGGRLVMHIAEMPIKCPVAPLEFLFLADWFFHEQGIRDRVELTLATPLPGAFTKPRASEMLGGLLSQKGIHVEPEFNIEHVDPDERKLVSFDEREVEYDLLVTVPVNMGSEVIDRSGMGDELMFVPTDKHTLRADAHDNIFVLGDATNLPGSKAGSVAHFQVELFVENFKRTIHQQALVPSFDGHANCYIESGFGKGLLIDFNYDVEPLPGRFPLPGVGPFTLLQESRANHWGKLMFRWIYWHLLLKGKSLPVPAQMSMAGKWN